MTPSRSPIAAVKALVSHQSGYAAHDDPTAAAINIIALMLAWNGPLYPVYVIVLTGRAGLPWCLLTMLISPFFYAIPWLSGISSRAARLALSLPNRFMWWNPIQRERFAPVHGYPRYATHAIAQAAILGQELMSEARRSAPAARDLQIVLNASESTVNNRQARRLAALWSAHKGTIVQQRLKGLPFSHDIIEPLRSPEIARSVAVALLELVER